VKLKTVKRRQTRRRIAPQLFAGSRNRNEGRLAPQIQIALDAVARQEGCSRSYVVEEVLIDFFKLDRPTYRHPEKVHAPNLRRSAYRDSGARRTWRREGAA
jgi:hypothetical protein